MMCIDCGEAFHPEQTCGEVLEVAGEAAMERVAEV